MRVVFGDGVIEALASELGVQERERRLDVVRFVSALVLNGGSDKAGLQADVLRRYLDFGATKEQLARSAFYAWFTPQLEALLTVLLARALAYSRTAPVLLRGILAGVKDWRIVDATTVRLPDTEPLLREYPGTGEYAAIKIHRCYSLGRGNLESYAFSAARDHDSPHLSIDASWRGYGLLADLAYVSHARIADCLRHGVEIVFRLKEGWKPTVERLHRADGAVRLVHDADCPFEWTPEYFASANVVDADVLVGDGADASRVRLVGVRGPQGALRYYLTTLPRHTHTPQDIATLYRLRWEIEIDNKLEKSGCRLDELLCEKPVTVRTMLLASMLNATLARTLVHLDKVELRTRMDEDELDEPLRPPLHTMLVVRVMTMLQTSLVDLSMKRTVDDDAWDGALVKIRCLGHDPNWRRSPSVLDIVLGLTGTPRPRRTVATTAVA
jgi:hypothetical protein